MRGGLAKTVGDFSLFTDPYFLFSVPCSLFSDHGSLISVERSISLPRPYVVAFCRADFGTSGLLHEA